MNKKFKTLKNSNLTENVGKKQTINSTRLNSQSLKYSRFTSAGCKDREIRKLGFEASTQFIDGFNFFRSLPELYIIF